MKKSIAALLVVLMTMCATSSFAFEFESGKGRGGAMGFISGCCFGIRSSGDYNEGKEIHWREWGTLIPLAGAVIAIWNGVEGAKGTTTAQYAKMYGSTFY